MSNNACGWQKCRKYHIKKLASVLDLKQWLKFQKMQRVILDRGKTKVERRCREAPWGVACELATLWWGICSSEEVQL